MQGQELHHAVDALRDPAVVALDQLLLGGSMEMAEQLLDAVLDEEDAGRFERLDEAAREADGDTVAHPRVAAAFARRLS